MSAQPTQKEDVFCYVGKKSCGCCVAAAVDRPEYVKETAKNISEWIKDGLTIERRPLSFVQQGGLTGCKCEQKQESLF